MASSLLDTWLDPTDPALVVVRSNDLRDRSRHERAKRRSPLVGRVVKVSQPGSYADDEAVPGVAPGSRMSTGPMFAALYGRLTPHAWRTADSDRDPYSLFYQRSLALGILDDRGFIVSRTADGDVTRPVGAAGLWATNDAGFRDQLPSADQSLLSWFQVGVEIVPADRPLPAQVFLRCAGEATQQLGTLELDAVHMLLPVDGLDVSSRAEPALAPSLQTASWFDETDPHARRPIQLKIESGRSALFETNIEKLTRWVIELDQNVFSNVRTMDLSDSMTSVKPPFDDTFRSGPATRSTIVSGSLVEWSLDAIGWLCAFVGDLAARLGATAPLLLTIQRTYQRP